MRAFRKADIALISNAQCLNEGVDVPTVDMVAFMSPKKSKVSIVQAVGRALRKPRGSNKEWGYVFVPIFLEKASGETDIEAAERSNFKDIYEVINALRDHDEVLDEVIKNLRIQKGNKGKINGGVLDDYMQIIGFDLSIDNLEKYIQSEIVERMTSNWLETFGKGLKMFEDYKSSEQKNEVTSKKYEAKYPGLYNWQSKCRTRSNNGKLSEEQIKMLKKANFIFDGKAKIDERWYIMIEQLKKYKVEHGHTNVPQYPKPTSKLGRFVNDLRNAMKAIIENKPGRDQKGFTLTDERIKQLGDMGFIWDLKKHWWMENYKEAKAHKEKYGHLNFRESHAGNHRLTKWIGNQKIFKSERKLEKWREDLLNEIGFWWGGTDDELWHFKYNIFLKRIEKIGLKNLSQTDEVVGSWISGNRIKYRKGTLDKKKIRLLEAEGLDLSPKT